MASATELFEMIKEALARYISSGRSFASIQMSNGAMIDTSRCRRLLSVREDPSGGRLHFDYPGASNSLKCSPGFDPEAEKPEGKSAWQIFIEWARAVLRQKDPKKIPNFPPSLVLLGSM